VQAICQLTGKHVQNGSQALDASGADAGSCESISERYRHVKSGECLHRRDLIASYKKWKCNYLCGGECGRR
jgi:hypothetical protein